MISKGTYSPKDFEGLFKYNFRPLCIYALHHLSDIYESEDLVQDCFMKLWDKICSGAQIPNPRAYLYASVRNACLDHLKKRSVVTESLISSESREIIDDDLTIEDSQIESRLWTAIDSLPDKCRQVFLLSKRDGLKYEEIAQELDISVNTVKNQVSKALKIIKEGTIKLIMFFFA